MECNGQNDCIDNSDESRCADVSSTTVRVPSSSVPSPSASEECGEDEFLCESGACISMSEVLFISYGFSHKYNELLFPDRIRYF